MNLIEDLKLVLFDLDGVLVDTCELHYEALNKALEEKGFNPIPREDHVNIFNGLPTNIKLENLNIHGEIRKEISELKQKYTREAILDSIKIDFEKIELHQYLKDKNIKIGCVTNCSKESAHMLLKQSGQFGFIDWIITNEDVKKNKPSPEGYNLAIELSGLEGEKCLCVEDSDKGFQAAIDSNAGYVWRVINSLEVTLENMLDTFEEE